MTRSRIGDLVDHKYEVVRLLGAGVFGEVYEAVHREMARRVVLKFLWPAVARHPELVARFRNEARAAGNLRHENIVFVYDLGQTGEGENYIAMEHCEGLTREEHLRKHPQFPLARATDIICQVCSGLAEAHSRAIVHRDLKPANLLLSKRADGSVLVKILDFGIAKLGDDTSVRARTRTGVLIGTPLYMSPEQVRGERDVDRRTDIYAVGVLLYELLSGSAPFAGATSDYEILAQIQHAHPPALDSVVAGLPAGIAAVVSRAVARQKSDRYSSTSELAAALRDCVDVDVRPVQPQVPFVALAPSVPALPGG